MLTALFLVLASGCMRSVTIEVLQPAEVDIPENVKVLAVIDRSRAGGFGPDGAAAGTWEAMTTANPHDRGRERVLSGVIRILDSSPRFEVVVPTADPRTLRENVFDHELTWIVAQQLCRSVGAQGLLSLEAFDSESSRDVDREVEEFTNDDGQTVRTVVFRARQTARVVAKWRIYDVAGEALLDELSGHTLEDYWDTESNKKQEALDGLPKMPEVILNMSEQLGAEYGARVAPSWIWVTRRYYAGGDPKLRNAKFSVLVDDWDGAEEEWRAVAENSESDVRGRAEFNVAVALERQGRLRKALLWAKKAELSLGNGRARAYVRTIQQRIEDHQRLRQQMRGAPKERDEMDFPAGQD